MMTNASCNCVYWFIFILSNSVCEKQVHAIIYLCQCHLVLHGDWPTMRDVLVWYLASVHTMHYILPLLTQKMIKMLLTIQQYLHKLVTTSYAYIQYSVTLITISTHYTIAC